MDSCAAMHDPLMRSTLMSVPVTPDDFSEAEYAVIWHALNGAVKITNLLGRQLPTPPSKDFLRSYLNVAALNEELPTDMKPRVFEIVEELQNPAYAENHYCVRPYLELWYGGGRAKKAARKLQADKVPDVPKQLEIMQQALSAAHQASRAGEDDLMDSFLGGQSLDRIPRRPTGIAGLDDGLNGGWGRNECYLLFGGTGSGKSIAAAQCAWWEAVNNDGWPLVITTELFPREYAARTVSNAAGIPIPVVQDCENIVQIRQAVAADPAISYRLKKVDEVLDRIRDRIRYHKVSPEEGMNLRMLMEREVLLYEKKTGHLPTWICLDWLGSVADLNTGGARTTSERALVWEMSANSGVKFAEDSGIPTLILAQAVNDAQLKRILTINDIGISKGIGKNMIVAIGVTNTIDKAGITAAERGKGEMPRSLILEDQFFCLCKARKGEGTNIPVRREFRFQRFTSVFKD